MDYCTIKQKDMVTNEKIFLTVANINLKLYNLKKKSSLYKIFSIVFDDDVKFINPLFFSLVIQLHERYIHDEIIVVFDVLNFIQDNEYKSKDPRQHYVYRILLSMIDTPHFLKYHRQTEYRINDFRDNLDNHINKKVENEIYKDKYENMYKKFIVLLYSRKHTDTIFLTEEEDKTYKLLPIIKLTNFPKYIYDNNLSSNEFDARKKIYESITIAADKDYDSNTLKKTFVNNFMDIVKPSVSSSSIAQPLKDIFFEMIDNIKRHAKYDNGLYANSYFNFYYDVPFKTFKFHIIDNLDTGFINTYIETLEKDRGLLEKKGLKADTFYADALEYLRNSDNDENFLKLFFSEYGWFRANKIPRILLHFGIPLLVEIIKRSSGEAYIRLHRSHENGDKFYEVKVSENGTEVKTIKKKREQIKGTYIAVNIPDKKYLQPSPITRNFGKEDFKTLETQKDMMISIVKQFIEKAKKKEKYAIYDYSQVNKKDSISDFIRKIYIEAHQKGISDALVVNIDLKENIEYFKTFSYLLYHKDYKETDDFLPVNILFWDISSFDIFFVGGKDRHQFCKSNQLLYSHYGQKNDFILDELCLENSSCPAESIFFIEENKENFSVLPFELLTNDIVDKTNDDIWKNLSYQRTIVNHLEKNKIDIHFDTQRGYHIDGFYKFDTIFQDSTFFERLIYILIDKISSDLTLKKKKLVFIGFGKYLNLFIALLIDVLAEKNINIYERYHIVDGKMEKDKVDDGENDNIETFIESAIQNSANTLHFIMITPVTFSGESPNKFIDRYIKQGSVNSYSWYSLIQIILEEHDSSIKLDNFESLIELSIPKESYHDLNKVDCPICSKPESEKPLLKIDKNDEFKLEKTYFSPYEKKEYISTTKVDDIKFYNSISFGHIIRGRSNHYLYYTKTVNFFEDNKYSNSHKKDKKDDTYIENQDIKCFLNNIKKNYLIENLSNAILLLPMHCTVNRFASMVQSIIFDNKANVFQFDKSKGIKNFHELKKQLREDIDYKFYFIDDEMSSGYTLEYFYSLVKYCGKDSFERIFILIDRMDSVDEKLVLNYIKDNDKKNIHIFSKMEIKPIKTSIEDCFLCETRKKYKERLENTSIDMNRFALASRIVKLNIQDSKLYDFEESKKFNKDDFRLYLKMYAVDYIYENFQDIYIDDINKKTRENILEHYNQIEKRFVQKVQEKIKALGFNKQEQYNFLLEEIGNYEGSIAFLKALSFPKLVYYYNIRYMLTVGLINRIQNYREKDAIESILDSNMINEFKEVQEKENYKSFLEHFAKKINMNYLGFLYKTAAYLDIHYVIHMDNVKKYYTDSKQIKAHDEDLKDEALTPYLDQSLVEYYQLASKMVAEYSEDRARHLRENIEEIRDDIKIDGYDGLLGALLIENHYDKEIVEFQEKIRKIIKTEDDPYNVIKKIEEETKEIMKDNSLKIYSLYINQFSDLKHNSYAEYLERMDLVDIMNAYKKPYKGATDIEERLTKGYLSRRKDEIFNPNDPYHAKRINNTWSNLFTSKYIIDDGTTTNATLIKLVDINTKNLDTKSKVKITKYKNIEIVKENNTLWYLPMGCIVVTYDIKDKDDTNKKDKHLELSKYLLSIQGEIVSYLKSKFSYGVIQEAIQKNNQKMEYKNILSNINHSVREYLNIKAISEHLSDFRNHDIPKEKLEEHIHDIRIYSFGLRHLSSIAELKLSDNSKNNNVYEIFYFNGEPQTFLENLNEFTKVAHKFLPSKFLEMKDNIKILDDSKDKYLLLDFEDTKIEHLIFEIIFNALKCETDDGYQSIKIEFIENGIKFRNKLREKDQDEAIKKINGISSEIGGFGMTTIREALNEHDGNYSINAYYDEINKEINITIKGDKDVD